MNDNHNTSPLQATPESIRKLPPLLFWADTKEAREVSAETLRLGRQLSRYDIARFLRKRRLARIRPGQTHITSNAAAACLTISRVNFAFLIEEGVLPSRPIGRRVWEVPLAAFLAFSAEMETRRRAEDEAGLERHIAHAADHARRKHGPKAAQEVLQKFRASREREKEERRSAR